ncbi:AhpC/TSA family protein [Alteribacillus bidgolensis]|uniref:AhpC/TSA family protein n=2 Tax=Alteribacillus bidgolensis TaxID=930129 RepID=A0A1G8R732_9BACI|nr:AhpC/TSA family protein [Alteribacillus bidgolensis]
MKNKKNKNKKATRKNTERKKKPTKTLWFAGSIIVIILAALFVIQMTVEEDKNVAGLPAGTTAPNFTLSSTEGEFSLSDYKDKNVVIYFYEGNT